MKYLIGIVAFIVIAVAGHTAMSQTTRPALSCGIKASSLPETRKALTKSDPKLAKNLPDLSFGLFVMEAEDDGSFGKAGIKFGDIILRIGNTQIKDLAALNKWEESAEVGKTYPVSISRSTEVKNKLVWKQQVIKVTMKAAKKDAKLTPSPDKKWDVAGQTVFDVKGMHIGDILNKEFAYHHCPVKNIEEHLGWIWSDDKQIYVDNGKSSDGNITGSDSFEIDGKSVFVSYTFQKRLLVGVVILFDTGLYDTIKKVYTDKFKQEPKVSHNTVTTGMGVKYTNETSTWQTSSGPFNLNRYGADIKNGSGMLLSPELEKAFNEQEGKAKEALKEKL